MQRLAWAVISEDSTLGPNEILMYVRVAIDRRPFMYCALAYVDGDAPLAMGREVVGFPKKLAVIETSTAPSGPVIFTVERPARKRLLTVTFSADRAATPDEFDLLGPTALRLISSSVEASRPSICELLEMKAYMHLRERPGGVADAWAGRVDVSMDSRSGTDPFYLLAPTRMLTAFRLRYDVALHSAVLPRDYLTEQG